jgi:glycosyltransferase involved in cell wall biosynthesis
MWNLYKVQAARLELLRRYDAILTHTDHMHDEMTRHGLKSTVVPYAVAVAAHSSPIAPRSNDTCRLLFAGRMERLKGGQYLLEALPGIVAALERPVHVIFAGDGTEREAWESHARTVESSMPGLTIEFTGWISQLAPSTLMRQVDLLVVPSIWPEPFGAVGVVAGQYGIPAAAFAVGGIPQWLHDGVNGHLAPDSPPTAAGLIDAVVKCLVERAHYATLSRGARDVAATFTMETHLPVLLRVLEDVSHGPALIA